MVNSTRKCIIKAGDTSLEIKRDSNAYTKYSKWFHNCVHTYIIKYNAPCI